MPVCSEAMVGGDGTVEIAPAGVDVKVTVVQLSPGDVVSVNTAPGAAAGPRLAMVTV